MIALVVAAIGLQVISPHHRSGGPAASPRLSGTLLYTGSGFSEAERILSWDLGSDSVTDGPLVNGAVDLVDESSILPGWVGVTVRLQDGTYRADLFRSLDTSAKPNALAKGSIVDWTSDGSSVISVQRRRSSEGTGLSVVVDRTDVGTGSTSVLFADPKLDGDVVSVGGGGHPPSFYFSLFQQGANSNQDSVSIMRCLPKGRSRPVLSGFALLDVSPAGDRLVVPQSDLSLGSDLPGARLPQQVPSPRLVAGRTFYVPAGKTAIPTPYGSSSGDLRVLRLLAWAPDAAYALVVGSLGNRLGIWELRTTPTGSSSPPIFITNESGPTTWATFASGDVPVIETGDRTWLFIDGRLTPLTVPPGTPIPNGPILWTS